MGAIREFFAGEDVPKLASDEILFGAIRAAVEVRSLMARRQDRAYLGEAIPDAEISDDLELCHPLARISGSEISENSLPEAWEAGTSSVDQVIEALAASKGMPIPWGLVVDAVNDGLSKILFEITKGSPAQPWTVDDAHKIGLQISHAPMTIDPKELIGGDVTPAWESGRPTLGLIKETLESKKGVSIPDDVFRNAAEQAIDRGIIILADPFTNDLYQIHVRQPSWIRHAESHLTETEIQDLTETIGNLVEIAPELDFKFRIAITAEGEPPSDEVLEQINAALRKVTGQLKFN